MARKITVISVGPALCVPGGISRVIKLIGDHLPSNIGFHPIATFTRYTGYKGADRSEPGNRIGQAFVFLSAFVRVLVLALPQRAVFHVHFAGRGSLLRKGIICIVLRSLRCQYAVHSHVADTTLFHEWLPLRCRRMLLWGISGAGRVIVLTNFWHDYYSELLPLKPGQLLLLPNPADLPAAVPDRSAREGLRLLFLGRVGLRKGAFDVIRALAVLPEDVRSLCHLTMAGDGDLNEARKLAAALGCSNQVAIPGWVGTAEVDRLLETSDVLLLPSYAEGMAMALIEAMSWGLSVVTTSAGGAGEFLDQGRNCILVAPGDVQGISRAISALARDAELRQELGRAARETISRFNIESYILRLSRVYDDLASRLPGERPLFVPVPDLEAPAPFVAPAIDDAVPTLSMEPLTTNNLEPLVPFVVHAANKTDPVPSMEPLARN